MKKRILSTGLLFLLTVSAGTAQSLSRIEREFRTTVGTLAGEEMAGRAAGTRGDTLAVAYLRDFLDDRRGIELLFDDGVQSFTASGRGRRIGSFNVAGFIEGRDPVLKNEVIVIGAHYDHMGLEADRFGEEPAVKYGADDNASGTAMVMALARQLARERRRLDRSVMIVFFGAEEQGLVGSEYLTGHMPAEVPLDEVVCMVNFDMVGRLTPERGLNLYGKELRGFVRTNPWPYEELAPLYHRTESEGNSDHASFAARNIPAFMFITGVHSDYHTSADTADKVNYYGMALIYRYALQLIRALDDLPATF